MTGVSAPNSQILEEAKQLKSELVAMRRKIHANPELSFVESETGKFVAQTLNKLGYDVRPGVAGTGVIAEIGSGRTVIIRADLDALPIHEANDVPYRSQNEGVMHACGHDAHTACALGAAMLIARQAKSKLNGCVRFLFQPAEETINEDGKSGAMLMLESGATHQAEAILALHVFGNLPVGHVAVKEGPLLAACDSFNVRVKGEAAHGAYPENGVDAIVMASHVVQALQGVISRRKSALDPAVVTVGGIRSTTYRHNIVAEEVQLTGTVRYFKPELHELLFEEIRRACSVATALGGSFEIDYVQDNPPLVNDPQIANLVRSVALRVLGPAAIHDAGLEMGADDFSFFSAEVPGCYFLLGARIDGSPRMLHTPSFDIDEDALPVGAAMLAESALQFLG